MVDALTGGNEREGHAISCAILNTFKVSSGQRGSTPWPVERMLESKLMASGF